MLSSDDALLAIAQAYGDSLRGRTLIQKVAYFIAVQTGSDLGYAPHYYGPYSAVMAATLSERVASGDLVEMASEKPVAFVGHEVQRYYRYELTASGRSAIEIHRSWHQEEFDKAVQIARSIRDLDVDYMQLSFAAKVHCISKQRRSNLTSASIQEAAAELGWEMKPEDIEQGKRILRKLGLLPETN